METLAVGEGTGAVSLAGTVSRLEVTGEARTISIDSSLDALVVSGSGNTISVKRGCAIGQIVILGTDNVLTLDGTSDTLLLAGRDNTVRGNGRVTEVQLNTRYYTLTVSKKQLIPWTGYDIKNVEVEVEAPAKLPAGESLKATAHLTVPEEDLGKLCTGSWYLNGELMSQAPVRLGQGDPVSDFLPNYTHDLKLDGTVKFVLSYENNDGDTFTKAASAYSVYAVYGCGWSVILEGAFVTAMGLLIYFIVSPKLRYSAPRMETYPPIKK